MFSRLIAQKETSFFLFGPRGTGKTTWIKNTFPDALYFDLLKYETYVELLANPSRLEKFIPPNWQEWVVIDEIQRVPELLNEVHRLIEAKGLRFILTGSSARKLRRAGVNLLAGRALVTHAYPLTCAELGEDFSMEKVLNGGTLPAAFKQLDPKDFLQSYVQTYLREEVEQEALVKNMGTFASFLEVASFSQGNLLSISEVAREVGQSRTVIENYFSILEDLYIAYRIPVFSHKAKRRLVAHEKFYFFDAGVFRTLRPTGYLSENQELNGVALETLTLQELKALNEYGGHGYKIHFWRSATGLEVDFILHGEKGLKALEIKTKKTLQPKDLHGLRAFLKDYPEAEARIFYGGSQKYYEGKIEVIPFEEGLKGLRGWL